MIGIQIIEILATFAEVLVGIWVNTEILSENEYKKKNILWVTIIVTFMVWMLNQYKLFSVFTTIFAILGIVIGAYVICRMRVLDSLVLTVFYIVLMYILDFFSLSIFNLFYQEDKWAHIVTSDVSLQRVYPMCFSKILLVVVSYWLVSKCLCKVALSVRKMWIGVLLCCFFLFYLVKSTFFEVDVDLLVTWLFFLIIIMLAIYLLVQYNLNILEKRHSDEKQAFYHDLENQHVIIKNYIGNKEYEKVEEYIHKLEGGNSETLYKQRTGIKVVDILLESKIKAAEAEQIDIDVDAEIINLHLTEQEVISLLGNALDNALEACRKITNGTKWIRIVIRKQKEMTLIKISNSSTQQPLEDSGHFLSSKKDPQLHGLGTRRMKKIVERHGGMIKYNYSQAEFSVTISFFE